MPSVFDIIGPVMIGPSSSHTAGAVNIGRVARQGLGCKPDRADITLYGSFAQTYKGHGTDRALIAGMLGMTTYDPNIKDALEIAKQQGLMVNFSKKDTHHPYHSNTAKIDIYGNEHNIQIVGISIGGGRILIKEIDDFEVEISGEYHTIVCSYKEQVGVIASISKILASENVNIAFMKASRCKNRTTAIMVVEIDQPVEEHVLKRLNELEVIYHVQYVKNIET